MSSLIQAHLFRFRGCPSFLYWIEVLTLPQLLHWPKEIGAMICSVKFFYSEVTLLKIFRVTLNTVFIPGLVLVIVTWVCWVSCRNEYIMLMFLHVVLFSSSWIKVEIYLVLLEIFVSHVNISSPGKCLVVFMFHFCFLLWCYTIFLFIVLLWPAFNWWW